MSEIFVEHVGEGLAGKVRSFREYKAAEDAFLIHHSMGHQQTDWIRSLRGPKILVYHNITPAEFFPDGSVFRKYSQLGREQLKLFLPEMAAAIADSAFNGDELRTLGYSAVSDIPLLVDIDALRKAPWNPDLSTAPADAYAVLFVGRIAENKCQHDLIEVIYHLQQMLDRAPQLILVGNYDPRDLYFHRLKGLIESRGLSGRVVFTGKVSDADLLGWYRRADVLVCLSEHEGFGVPLIEGMALDVPVLAYDSTSVGSTMGGAGLLLGNKNHREIAALIQILSRDRALRRVILRGQRKRVEHLSSQIVSEQLREALAGVGLEGRDAEVSRPSEVRSQWQIEGPFETSYSLALVNRETARALETLAPDTISLFATEGPGDYTPKPSDLARVPDLKKLWQRGRKGARPDVVLRNLYPPRVRDTDGLINLLFFAWEESEVPGAWVEQFNRHLDGCPVPSEFVKKSLIDSGVALPIAVVGYGTEHLARERRQRFRRALGRGFRFLHVSSGFPRKGIDCLLEAYGSAFSSKDEVTLVIKTFPNIHNRTREQIAEWRGRLADPPHVIFIDGDHAPAMVADLYRQCQAYVGPSRGEGFGLPMAEAMCAGLPVITTAGGGQADFCTEETSWLVKTTFARSGSHHEQGDSVWLEPDVRHLAEQMLQVFRASPTELRLRTDRAKRLIERDFTWARCAERMREFVHVLERRPPMALKKLRLGWFSTWNAKCGVATYSSYLLRHFSDADFDVSILASQKDDRLESDGPNVIRCWDPLSRHLEALEEAIAERQLEVVVFQFNFGFLRMQPFGALIERLHARGIHVLVTLHSTGDVNKAHYKASLSQIKRELALADRLLVHSVSDLNFLKQMGLESNATLFPHGVFESPPLDRLEARRRIGLPEGAEIVAAYGFLLPNKGIEQLINAFAQIVPSRPNARLLLVTALYPGQLSAGVRKKCVTLISKLGIDERVVLTTDFLREEESIALLQCADLVAFPYQATAESVSGAVRFGLSARRPVACTPLPIFSDVRDITHAFPGTTASELATGIGRLLDDSGHRQSKQQRQADWLKSHAWDVLANRLQRMIQGICINAQTARGAGVGDTEDAHESTTGEYKRLAN